MTPTAGVVEPLRSTLALPSLVLVLLPKCPLCLVPWTGVLGTGVLAALPGSRWLALLTVAALALAVAAVSAAPADGRGHTTPRRVAIAAAVAILAAKFVLDSRPLALAGATLLLVAAIWSARRGASRSSARAGAAIPHCSTTDPGG